MCYNIFQDGGGDKDRDLIGNRACSPGLEERGLEIFVPMGWIVPCSKRKPRVQWPNHPEGSHGQNSVPRNHWELFGPPSEYLGSAASQCQTSLCPLMWWNDYTYPTHIWYHWVGFVWSDFSFLNIGLPGYSNIHNLG